MGALMYGKDIFNICRTVIKTLTQYILMQNLSDIITQVVLK